MSPLKFKLRTQLIVGFLLITVLGFFQFTKWISSELRPHFMQSMEESLVDVSTLLATEVSVLSTNDSIDTKILGLAIDSAISNPLSSKLYTIDKNQFALRVYVCNRDGIVIFDSQRKSIGEDFSKWNDVYLTLKGEYGARTTRDDLDDPETSIMYIAAPIVKHGEIIGSLTVCKAKRSLNRFIFKAQKNTIITGAIFGTLVLIMGILITLFITRPINKLTKYAQAVKDGETVTLPHTTISELQTMGKAMEEMRLALDGKAYIENYIQTLTHEIKSPLSSIKGASELLNEDMPIEMQKKFLGNILTETNRIQLIIDTLLELSSVESRNEVKNRESINLFVLFENIKDDLYPQFTKREVELKISCDKALYVNGERFLIRQSLVNLIINALDFSARGDIVEIIVKKYDESLLIKVIDSGVGIPNYALEKIFDKFYSLPRPETKKKSSGLGLSFVKEAIKLHGGSVELKNRSGHGVEAVVVIPIG